MGDAFPASLYVQFQLFVPLYGVLFDELDIHAGIFNGRVLLAAGHFNGDPRLNIGSDRRGLRFGRGCRWIMGSYALSRKKAGDAKAGNKNCRKFHKLLNPMVYGTARPGQVRRLSYDAR